MGTFITLRTWKPVHRWFRANKAADRQEQLIHNREQTKHITQIQHMLLLQIQIYCPDCSCRAFLRDSALEYPSQLKSSQASPPCTHVDVSSPRFGAFFASSMNWVRPNGSEI